MLTPFSRLVAAGLLLVAAATGDARADHLDPGAQGDAEIVVMVAMADRRMADCVAAGMDEATRMAFNRWVEANHVERGRAEMARLAAEPAIRRSQDRLDSQVEQVIAATGGESCLALQSLARIIHAT